jgi:hypothetical protein
MMAKTTDMNADRLAGAAFRISNSSDEIDDAFLGRAGGSVASFVFLSEESPATAARQLVSAGLVSADNPMAVALQEEGPVREAAAMTSQKEMIKAAHQKAMEISKSTDHRDVRVKAAALTRRLTLGKMSHQSVAGGFEAIATGAQTHGCDQAARKAGEAFAAVSIAGTAQNLRQKQRPRRRSGHEIE